MIQSTHLAISGDAETYLNENRKPVIDLSGGFGFQVPAVIDAVVAQANIMGLSNRVLISEPLLRLCRTVASLLPQPLASSYVCSSGDEAFEGALKLCKGLHPKRKTLVYVSGGDYGSLTFGRCMSAPEQYQEITRFLGVRFEGVRDVAELQALDLSDCFAICHTYVQNDLDGRLQHVSPLLIEGLHRRAGAYRVPVIGMDAATCLGRLGTFFGFEGTRCVPDIVVLGGSLGGGAIPIGMYVCSEEMAYRIYGRSTPAKHGSTTAGNPMSCVAALAALKHALAIDAPARCIDNGRALATGLSERGALARGGIVTLPLRAPSDARLLRQRLYERGLYVPAPKGPELVLQPPVCARREVVVRAAGIIEEAMNDAVSAAA